MYKIFVRKYSAFKRMDFFDLFGYAKMLFCKAKTRWIYAYLFGKIGKGVWIKKPAQIYGAQNIFIGDDVRIERGGIFYAVKYYGGKKYNSRIVLGNGTFANRDLNLTSAYEINIGKEVVFGPNVFLTDFDHGYDDVKKSRLQTDLISKGPINIGDRCWIGANSFIGSGVELGEYCVVAANSVVTKSFPAYSVIAGVPAKLIKVYDPSIGSWIKVNKKTCLEK
ncbi:acyltransferase [Janthinobacterium sp. LB2P49]|uniref:acyltransferase n=1 Tax=Janthinobacterium sp. LB2P49 TaxID=3424198 RepID=UPI003F26BF32